MARRLFCFLCVLVLVASFCAPVFADNTVGELESDCQFVGVTYYNSWKSSNVPLYWAASDDIIGKMLTSRSNITFTSSTFVYYFWRIPDCQEIDFSVSLGLAADFPINDVWVYLANYNSSNNFNLSSSYSTLTKEQYFYDFHDGLTHVNIDDFFVDQSGFSSSGQTFDYLCVVLNTSSDSTSLNQSLTFSDEVASRSFRLTPSDSSSTVSLTGRVGFGTLSSNYTSGTSPSYNSLSSSLLSIAPSSSGSSVSGAKFVSTTVLSNIFGSSAGLTSSSSTLIHTADSGTVSNTSYSASYTSGGTISASASSDVLFYGSARAWYGDDDGLVDTVKHMDTTLDGVADNMQQLIDRMAEEDATGDEIGGTVSDDTIATTDETLSGGVESLDTLSSAAVSDFSGLSAQSGGMIALMSLAVPSLLTFGDGQPFLVCLVIVVVGSVLLFVIKLLKGD